MMYSSHYHGRQGSLPEAFSAGVFILGGIFLLVAFLCTVVAGFEGTSASFILSPPFLPYHEGLDGVTLSMITSVNILGQCIKPSWWRQQ